MHDSKRHGSKGEGSWVVCDESTAQFFHCSIYHHKILSTEYFYMSDCDSISELGMVWPCSYKVFIKRLSKSICSLCIGYVLYVDGSCCLYIDL